MARKLERGQIWQLRFAKQDKRRPVLVLSRNSLLEVLHTATVAPITSTVRGSPTEVEVGPDEGLKGACAVNLVNLQTVRQHDLHRYIGSVSPSKMRDVCYALEIACGCV